MQIIENRNLLVHQYPSLAEFADYQAANVGYQRCRRSFSNCASVGEAAARAKAGLPEFGVRVLDTSKAMVDSAMRQVTEIDMFSTYDVTGSYVDMGRFLDGTPECMVDSVFEDKPKTTPVVTIVSNVNASGGIDKEELETRGRLVVALIKAIETSGRATELWVDSTNIGRSNGREIAHHFRIAVRIRAAGQPLDMGSVMYAFTDPSMLRALCFNAMHRLTPDMQRRYGVGAGYGCVETGAVHVEESYGENAVYLPAVRLGERQDSAERTVTRVLERLGIA
ncbi:DUF7192 family protein [Mycolicibacterium sphagni]|uniref:DUF7192 domain-containing protein n=1 Tax=Mycolicibacterium sphagni TaxID=1786 RepID=A0A255DSU2_9MYCO|nr:hypothetical protein [Mycolicibacterium sphagni]OYN81761.1 hypothetical protein CG716_05310 [Mycolicibacterium sphagni]